MRKTGMEFFFDATEETQGKEVVMTMTNDKRVELFLSAQPKKITEGFTRDERNGMLDQLPPSPTKRYFDVEENESSESASEMEVFDLTQK